MFPSTYLGVRPYREVWELQEQRRAAILAGKEEGILYLLQHPPTITLGRGEKGTNLLYPTEELKKQGFDVVETNRGGMVTYHGPGQLIAYPVFDLRKLHKGVKQFVDGLERTMIGCLARIGISAHQRKGYIGTWVGEKKIGAIGIHVRRQVSIHGLALNVATNLDHFNVITACGIEGIRLTSVQKEGVSRDVPGILEPFLEAFTEVFGA
ncbi:MAG: lipoyl(octanoyl) transferase LipB [Pseudomonadota bacterium]